RGVLFVRPGGGEFVFRVEVVVDLDIDLASIVVVARSLLLPNAPTARSAASPTIRCGVQTIHQSEGRGRCSEVIRMRHPIENFSEISRRIQADSVVVPILRAIRGHDDVTTRTIVGSQSRAIEFLSAEYAETNQTSRRC